MARASEFASLLLIAAASAAAQGPAATTSRLDYALPADNGTTQRNDQPALQEWVRHEVLLGRAPLKGWTRSCGELDRSAIACPEAGALRVEQGEDFLILHPVGGMEWRQLGEHWAEAAIRSGGTPGQAWNRPAGDSTSTSLTAVYPQTGDFAQVTEMGAQVLGRKGNLQLMLDARIYSESRDERPVAKKAYYSYDRDFIEVQTEGDLSNLSYVSYGRYRASLSYAGEFGTLGYRRDALQWGPGLYHNLVFGGNAIPFNQFYYSGEVGPVRVTSLWGELAIDGAGSFRKSTDSRQVYAHRYEWNILPDLLLGITEQLILYESSAPAALIPIVPLFMEKGQGVERNNNGNLALDLAWRLPAGLPVGGMLYSEFLVDDLQEPSSLFDDFWGNRWGWMAGAQLARDFGRNQVGLIGEYVRIEPWVYTHYEDSTSQSAHRGYPLGEQLGPNSQALTLKAYARSDLRWTTGLRLDWSWKGTEAGSSLDDAVRDFRPATKEFLAGAGNAHFAYSPSVAYTWGNVTLEALATVRGRSDADWSQRVFVKF